jgi:hypothetical protein
VTDQPFTGAADVLVTVTDAVNPVLLPPHEAAE